MMNDNDWVVLPMNARRSLESYTSYSRMIGKLCAMGCDLDTAKAMGENATICAFSIFDKHGKQVFCDADEVLDSLTLSEIAQYVEKYRSAESEGFEFGFNDNFGL